MQESDFFNLTHMIIMKKASYFIILSLILGALGTGCSSSLRETVVTEDGREHVWLQHEVEKKDGVEQPISQGFEHPVELSGVEMEALLKELMKKDYAFFKWSEAKSIFIDEEVKKLAPDLAKALMAVSSSQWVHFSVIGNRRRVVSDYPAITDGMCFVKDGKLNIIFSNISEDLEDKVEKLFVGDPREVYRFASVRVHSTPEKKINLPPVIEGDPWLSKERENWLTIDLASFRERFAKAQLNLNVEKPAKSNPAIRLKMLKNLLDQGLISDEEYNQKRKEILDQL